MCRRPSHHDRRHHCSRHRRRRLSRSWYCHLSYRCSSHHRGISPPLCRGNTRSRIRRPTVPVLRRSTSQSRRRSTSQPHWRSLLPRPRWKASRALAIRRCCRCCLRVEPSTPVATRNRRMLGFVSSRHYLLAAAGSRHLLLGTTRGRRMRAVPGGYRGFWRRFSPLARKSTIR